MHGGYSVTVGIGLLADAVAFPAVACRTYELMIVVETLGSRYAISAKWTSEMGSKPYFGRMPRQVRFFSQTADSAREDRFVCFVPRRGIMHARIGALTGGLPVVRGQALY